MSRGLVEGVEQEWFAFSSARTRLNLGGEGNPSQRFPVCVRRVMLGAIPLPAESCSLIVV